MTDVGLNDVHGARAENVVEFESVDKAFARCDRNAALGGYCGKARRIAGGSGSSMNSGCRGKCFNIGERAATDAVRPWKSIMMRWMGRRFAQCSIMRATLSISGRLAV